MSDESLARFYMSHDALLVMGNANRRARKRPPRQSADLRRRKVYAFVEKYVREHGGIAPLLREISAGTGAAMSSAQSDLVWLEEHKWISRKGNRTVKLLNPAIGREA